MVVIISNGNEGNNNFKYLNAPADAPEVISVGATYPMLKAPMKFSSYGPNSKGILKPEVSAPGYVVSAGKNGKYVITAGTSFSCPLVAGYVACLLQLHPDWKNEDVRKALFSQSHLYPYYDYRLGYGVPDARNVFQEKSKVNPTFAVIQKLDSLYILFPDSVAKRDSLKKRNGMVLNYNIADDQNKLIEFKSVILPPQSRGIKLPASILTRGRLRIWFDGWMWEE